MAETLLITKKSTKTWLHQPSDELQFIIGKFTFSIDGDFFQILELGQSKRNKYNFADITVYDETTSTTYDSFTSIVDLSTTLETLGYPAFLRDGDATGVISVNGLTGVVVLNGGNIDVTDPTTSTDATLNDALANIYASGGLATTDDIPTLDATPTNGSTNGVESNGVFDALATKQQLIGSISTPATITGTTTETIVGSIEVLANTFKTINFLEIYALSSKSNSVDSSIITIYLNDTNNLSGTPLQLATYGVTSTRITNMFRKATLFSNILDMNSSRTASIVTNIAASTAASGDNDSSVAYDVNTTKYIIFTVTNTNSALITKFKSAEIIANII